MAVMTSPAETAAGLADEFSDIPGASMVTIDYQLEIVATGLPSLELLTQAARRALHGVRDDAALTLRMAGRREARQLNRRFRNIDRPTNVLSFVANGLEHVLPTFLGDIVICVPLAREEARAQGKTLRAHCLHLSIHGLLHLVGYQHDLERDAVIMEERERAVMTALGFSDPYRLA